MKLPALIGHASLATTVLAIPATFKDRSTTPSYTGYRDNACNGQRLFSSTLAKGVCHSFADSEEASSFVIEVGKDEKVHLYYDGGCKDQVGTTTSTECYVVSQRVYSIMLLAK